MDHRFHRVTWGQPGEAGTRVRTSRANWGKPLTWDKRARANGTRPLVFCASLADVFDNQVDPAWRRDLFDLIRATPRLRWLLLTKRPQLVVRLTGEATRPARGETLTDRWPPNAYLGTTIEDNARLMNAAHLARAKMQLRIPLTFISAEPLLEDIADGLEPSLSGPGRVDWGITGGETSQGDHRARPSDPDWFREIRRACRRQGVLYHHKQMQEAGPIPSDLQIRERP